MNKKYRNRFIVAFLLLTGLFLLWWAVVAQIITSKGPALLAKAQGLKVGSASVSGFPLRFDVALEELRFEHPSLGISWQPPQKTLKPSLPALIIAGDFALDLEGEHQLALGESHETITLKEAILEGRMGLASLPAWLGFSAQETSGNLPGVGSFAMTSMNARADRKQISAALASARLDTAALSAVLPAFIIENLGHAITDVTMQGRFTPELPGGFASPLASLQSWQTQGGAFHLETLALRWGEVKLATQGALTLSENLEPIGQVTARLTGALPLIQRYLDGLELNFFQRAAIDTGLAASIRETQNGEKEIALVLTFEEQGLLYAHLEAFPEARMALQSTPRLN